MLADAHNCSDGLNGENLGHVVPGSKRSFDLIEGAGQVGETLADAPRSPLRMGVAWDRTSWDSTDGIGPLGVRVAVTEVSDQQTAYVLVDRNNMGPGLRDMLVDAVQDRVTNAEILTTDTHVVNSVDASNQVGERVEATELRSLVVGLLDDAIADPEPVEAGMVTNRAEVTVFGNDRTDSLASYANAMIQMGGALAVASVPAVSAISVLLILFI